MILDDIPGRVCGIPCTIRVVHHSAAQRATEWCPGEPEELEIEICDRNGRRAPWLERKMTARDWVSAENQAIEYASTYDPY